LEAVKHRQAVVEDVGIAACPQGEEWQASRTSDPLHGAKTPHARADAHNTAEQSMASALLM